jgi:NADH dehydrogenase FAD-containing subunit
VILGEAREINTHDKVVRVVGIDEKTLEIPYDELILALFLVPNLNRYPGLMAHANPINSVGDALHIRKQVMNRVEQAELEESPELRSRLLTFAVIGSGQRACATAEEINAMLETAKPSYRVLKDDAWRVHLYEDIKVPFSDFEAEIKARRDKELAKAGVHLFPDHEVSAVTPDSIVFTDGRRQPVGLVVNSCFTMPMALVDGETLAWPPETEPDLRLGGHPHIWATMAPAAQMQGQGNYRRYLTTSDWMHLGQAVGQNAWAASQAFETQPFQFKKRLALAFNMGRHSIARVFGWAIGGVPAWFLSRMTNLATMPGLERNLRILIDWTLDVPFRADIAVLAPDVTSKLQKLHLETGDEIIRQGEEGETAYIIQTGRVEIIKNGKKVGELVTGDFFGEIALVSDTKRTATVRCLTACELTVLSREDFQSLSLGSSVMAKAIKHQIEERTGKKLRTRRA